MSTRPRFTLDDVAVGAPGPWLRLAALGGALATALAVASGALHLGLAHRLLVATAVPFLVAVVIAGRLAYRRLLRPAARLPQAAPALSTTCSTATSMR